MIHYHGLPITPDSAAVEVAKAGHVFVSYRHPQQLGIALEISQSFALDNGAYPAWRAKTPITNWEPFYQWADNCRMTPNCDFAVIPDVIDGTEEDNDRLIREWPFSKHFGAPVWHMHESLEKLACHLKTSGFHEDIADAIYARLGTGRQTLTAFHHGVHIETRRGFD